MKARTSIKTLLILSSMLILFLAGCSGSNGKNGATGATGPAGTNGTNGANGTNGSNGSNGQQGAQGLTGPTMPVIQSISAPGSPAAPGTTVTVTVIAQSAQGLALNYTWSTTSWTFQSGENTSSATINAPDSYGVSDMATIEVYDSNGMSAVGSIPLSTEQDEAPVITSITAAPNPVTPGNMLTVTVNAFDPRGNPLNYIWATSSGWNVTGYGATATVTPPLAYNTYGYITATVGDGYGLYSIATIAIGTPAFPAPVLQSAVGDNGEAALSWAPSEFAVSYNVYDSQDNVTYTQAGSMVSTTSYTAAGLTNGTLYYFTVTAVDPNGIESSGSNVMSATPRVPVGKPTVPANLAGSAGDMRGELTWTASLGATGYNVYQYNPVSDSLVFIGTTAGTSFIATGLTNGTTYSFMVTAVNSAGESGYSNQATITPFVGPPSALIGTAGTDFTDAVLSWTVSLDPLMSGDTDAAYYNVYESVDNVTWSVVITATTDLVHGTTGATISPLTYGTVYYFTVTAVDSSGNESTGTNEIAIGPTRIYSVGSYPWGIAIDKSGNAWVTNLIGNNVTELSAGGITIGTYGVDVNPWGIAIDSAGNVLVGNNQGSNISVLSPTGTDIGTYNLNGAGGSTPTGMAIDKSGNIWVADRSNNTVIELNSGGTTIGTYGVGIQPMDLAIDSTGNVWVTNNCGNDPTCMSPNGTVTELNSSGITVGTYGVGNQPWGIAIDKSGNAWVTNSHSNTVTELSSSGITMGTYTVGQSPIGIAVDSTGNIWVANWLDFTVTALNPSGTTIGTYDVGSYPYGIAIDKSGNVWVACSGDNTVWELIGIAAGPQYWPYTGPVWPGGL